MPANSHHHKLFGQHRKHNIMHMQPKHNKKECKQIPTYIQSQFGKYPTTNIEDISYLSIEEPHRIENDHDEMSSMDTYQQSLRNNHTLQAKNSHGSVQKKTIDTSCEVCSNALEIDHIKFNTYEKAMKQYNDMMPGNTYSVPIEDHSNKSGWLCNNCFIENHDVNKRKFIEEDNEELKPKTIIRIVLQWSPYGSASSPFIEPVALPPRSGTRGRGSRRPNVAQDSTEFASNYYAIGLENADSGTDFDCITGQFPEEDKKTNEIVKQLKIQTTYEDTDIQTYHVKLPDDHFNKNLTIALTEPANIGSFGPIITIRESDLYKVTKTFLDETCKMLWKFEDPDTNNYDRIADFDFDGKESTESWLTYINGVETSTHPFIFKSIQGHMANAETGQLLDPSKRVNDEVGITKTPFRYSMTEGTYPNLPKEKFSVHRLLIEVPTRKWYKFDECVICMEPNPTHTMAGCNHVNLCEGDFYILNNLPNRRCPTCRQEPTL